jgi:hypothetical protein
LMDIGSLQAAAKKVMREFGPCGSASARIGRRQHIA